MRELEFYYEMKGRKKRKDRLIVCLNYVHESISLSLKLGINLITPDILINSYTDWLSTTLDLQYLNDNTIRSYRHSGRDKTRGTDSALMVRYTCD